MRNAIAALICVLFAGTASAQGFIRYIYPPSVVSMVETDSAIQVTKPFHFADGTASAPSFAFASSPTTGFYLGRAGADLPVSGQYGNTLDGNGLVARAPECEWVELGCAATVVWGQASLPSAHSFDIMRGQKLVFNLSGTQSAGKNLTLYGSEVYVASNSATPAGLAVTYGVSSNYQSSGSGGLSSVYGFAANIDSGGADKNVYGVQAYIGATAEVAHDNLIGSYAYIEMGDNTSVSNRAVSNYISGPSQSTDGTDSSKIFKTFAEGYGRSLIDQPRDTDYALELTNGQGQLITGKTNQLQLAKAAGGAKPTCAAAARGSIWYEPGGAGVLDTLEVCRKDAANNYAWVSLF